MISSRVNFKKEDIGAEILPILTTGLYRNTLDALREYVQNAVDAGAGAIAVDIDPDVVSISDDGTGMDREQARNSLRFGVSDKSPLDNIGFRGIGVYSGFNTCDTLEIFTKSSADPNTYKVSFDFHGIRTKLMEEQERRSTGLPPALHLERLLEESVFMESLGEEQFRLTGTTVILGGLQSGSYSHMNDWDHVVDYLRNVVPLPFNPDFRYGSSIEERFAQRDYRVVPITLRLGNRQEKLFRPYTDGLFKHGGRHEPKLFDIKGSRNRELGFAWVCVNDARETIKDVKLRGLLLKKFGFSISDRQYLEPYFGRPTYSRRITGEVIVTDERLIPNAARNDFENNSARQDFMMQLPKLTREIDRWADNIQETEKAREVLERTTQELLDITEDLPLLQRDRDKLLTTNAKLLDIARQIKPHRKRLESLEPDRWVQHKELLEGAGTLVKTSMTQNRRKAQDLETELAKAVQREAAGRARSGTAKTEEPDSIVSLVGQYLPLDETKLLNVIRILDEAVLSQQLDPAVYQSIVDAFREQLDDEI